MTSSHLIPMTPQGVEMAARSVAVAWTEYDKSRLLATVRAAWKERDEAQQGRLDDVRLLNTSIEKGDARIKALEVRIRELDCCVANISEDRVLAEKNLAAAEHDREQLLLSTGRMADLCAQLTVLYAPAIPPQFDDLVRWLDAHVPADIARLRKHSLVLQKIVESEAQHGFPQDRHSSIPVTKTLWVLQAQLYEAATRDSGFLDCFVEAFQAANPGM